MVKNVRHNLISKMFCFGMTNNFRSIHFYFLLFTFYFLIATSVIAQQDEPKGVAPPPLRILAKEEKSKLEVETDIKRRTKLSLELMEARLLNAETFGKQEQYREMFTELGSFHALMDNTLAFLGDGDTNKGKVLNNFKRVELSLRKYVTRLELIRRDLPIKFEFYVRRLVRYVREARTKAVEPLFGETVLPDKDNEK
ncbi:MAG: hypothetical protein M3388_18385 [Acidobacteriota bacterium]|nr:hypothetical protein [Acidobacteriota bacterium]